MRCSLTSSVTSIKWKDFIHHICTTQLQEPEYFGKSLKQNYEILELLQKIICYH